VIRVLLADDQVLVRAGFRLLLESAGDIAVVGEAANGGVAVALAREHAPDVVLMDLHMPEVDGDTVFAALRAGASGLSTLPAMTTCT
jgi:DNA-binding NarL/FixJ family response regulator